jgi:hypothetical protein
MIARTRSRFAATILAAGLFSISLQASADTGTAEILYRDAVKLMEEGKFDEACPKLVESQRIDTATGTLVALSKCYEGAGKTASAWSSYQDLAFAFKKDGNLEGEKAARKRGEDLEKKLDKLLIKATADAPGLVIRRDGQEIGKAILGTPVPVDPGKHIIEATAPGFQVWQTTITLGKESDTQTVVIPPLVEAKKDDVAAGNPGSPGGAPGPNKSLRTVSYVVGGVGVAGVLVGGIFGGLAASAKSTLKTECPNNACPTGQATDDLNAAKSKALISTLGLGIGGAALATGVVLFFVSGSKGEAKDEAKPEPKAAFVPVFGPQGGGFSFNGSF